MPDILNMAEDFVGEAQQYLEHPVAAYQRDGTDGY
jgi:hypothetical protein